MKTVYFVRHGESENNASGRYNALDTALSQKGEQQAEELAKRCKKLPIDLIVASDMFRAQQTAKIIAPRIGKSIETSAFFRERITAAIILGKKKDDPEITGVVKEGWENFHVPGWRAEGGENFEDLKSRALNGLDYLAKHNEDTILVVTHGFFMYFIAAAVMFGSELTSNECVHVIDGLGDTENTALTVVRQKKRERESSRSPWELYVWNDHAHLG